MDKSWMRTSRTKKQYIDGVEAFIKYADDLAKFQELLLDAKKPLYKGCLDFTKFSAIVKLLNLKGKYGASDNFFTELLGLLKKLLPADSHAWRTIDEKFPEIAKDSRNLRLGISADGVDVNSRTRHHSGKGKRTNNKTLENQEDTRGRGGKIQKQKRKTTEEEGSSNQTKDGMNARLDLAELGIKPELFARQEEDKTTLPPAGHMQNKNRPEGCIAEETIAEETIEFFREYHKIMKTIGIPHDKHVTNENEDGKPSSVDKSSEVSGEVFQKAHLYVERELAISKDSVSETVRLISYGPRATIVKYEAYNINGYTFRTKSNDGIVYQNSGVSVEAVDLHISKEVATTRKAF
nr:hypothetical protein [Tanacetum cinerariifolium]